MTKFPLDPLKEDGDVFDESDDLAKKHLCPTSASHKHRQREWDRKTLLDWKLPEEVALASLFRPKHPCSERGPIKAGKPWQFRFAA